MTNPEQSKPAGLEPPHTYRAPRCLCARPMTRRDRDTEDSAKAAAPATSSVTGGRAQPSAASTRESAAPQRVAPRAIRAMPPLSSNAYARASPTRKGRSDAPLEPNERQQEERPVSKRRSDGPPTITRCENQLDILTRCVNLTFEGRHGETQRNQNEAEDAGGEGHDGRPQEGSGVPRSGHQQGRRDDDGLGRCEPARGARARRARRVEREGRREALRRAVAGRDRGAPRLAGRGAPLADGVAGRCEG